MLPTLKRKESALRVEVSKARKKMKELEKTYEKRMSLLEPYHMLWNEFDKDSIELQELKLSERKIAGINIPILESISLKLATDQLFYQPLWLLDGLEILEDLLRLKLEKRIYEQQMEILDEARKKTTQKVNLYEKVQIPEFESSIRKIKRYMENEENVAKSAYKIVKKKKGS